MSRPMTPLIVRLMNRVDVGDGPGECWLWQGAVSACGYGVLGRGRRSEGTALAHRVTYEHYVGTIPPGLDLDHLCRVLLCCNPAHLEPVTRSENAKRQARAKKIDAIKAAAA